MSVSAKQERTICVFLPNKEQLDVTVGLKSTGQDVFDRVLELLGMKELHFFGLTVVKDNEHIFLDMDEKLTKYFPKDWKQDSGKGSLKRALPLVLFLKVQYYVENGRLICERKARHLYYSDLRERVLRSECRQQEEVYFQLAGYALQADLADHPLPGDEKGGTPYFQPKDYFPPWIVAKRGSNYLLCHGPKVHRELWGMPARDAALHFIRESCRLEDVPVTFYKLQKDKKAERGTALLGLTLRGMQVYQEVNNIRQLLYDFPWSNVGRLTFLGKKFEIQPDGLPSARKLVYYTGSPFRSRHLLLHLSSSHRLHLSLQPVLRRLRQLEEVEEKKRYRESYISDDMDLEPPGSLGGSPGLSRGSLGGSPGLSRGSLGGSPGLSRGSLGGSPGLSRGSLGGSPGLSRRSTSSSGIEADARQHSISMDNMEPYTEGEEEAETCLSSAASHGSSQTSGIDVMMGCKARPEEEGWHQEEDIQASTSSPKTFVDPVEMLHLADLLDFVSVDCPMGADLLDCASVDCPIGTAHTHWPGSKAFPPDSDHDLGALHSQDTLGQLQKPTAHTCVDGHSQSLHDVRLFSPPVPLRTTALPDASHIFTFGLPDPQTITQAPNGAGGDHGYQAKPSFYGRRSSNCLSLDLLGDEQLLEYIL